MTELSDLGSPRVHHSAFQIRTGKMDEALMFFEKIHWVEFPDMDVSGEWGQARFVSPVFGDHIVQLTELSDGDPEQMEMTETHLAIHYQHTKPEEVARAILEWANKHCVGEGAFIEPANAAGTKWFAYLPAIFKFAIEIV